jgi:hypothetical protein
MKYVIFNIVHYVAKNLKKIILNYFKLEDLFMSILDIFKKKESTKDVEPKTVEVPVKLTKKVNLAKEEVKKVCLTKESYSQCRCGVRLYR